jgi:hypothetical protein
MKKVILFVATGLLALGAAQIAKADASFTDPAGDSGAAPDITAVTAANDAPGANLTFTVRSNQASLAADATVYLWFDADNNQQTGNSGVEAVFVIDATGWAFLKWNGTQFAPANAASANGSHVNGLTTFKISKADLGAGDKFRFWADTDQVDANGNPIAQDTAPDGDAVYQYTIAKPLTLRAGTATTVPLRPRAGKAFAVRARITRGDTGGPLASGTVTCTVRVGTARIRATGRVSGGVAVCNMTIPKTAKGKFVRGTMKVTFQGVSTTKTFSYRVVA